MSPFLDYEIMNDMITFYNQNKYDSVCSSGVNKDFFIMNDKPLNFTLESPPNSQDLVEIKNITFGFCIINTDVAKKKCYIIGYDCFYYPINEIESIDIDTPVDFKIAELLLNNRLI